MHNYCIAVKEEGDDIVFLRKIIEGGADKSYGIQVARLAGVPDAVIERAKEIAEKLTSNDILENAKKIDVHAIGKALSGKNAGEDILDTNVIQFLEDNDSKPDKKTERRIAKESEVADSAQMSFFANSSNQDIIEELLNMDLQAMSPIEALNSLYAMQKKVKNRLL